MSTHRTRRLLPRREPVSLDASLLEECSGQRSEDISRPGGPVNQVREGPASPAPAAEMFQFAALARRRDQCRRAHLNGL